MITRITIPQIFENMEEATIGAWLKSEGDTIRAGDALCELITEKTTADLDAEGDGILRLIAAPEKSIVPVGAIIGVIAGADEALPDIEAENAAIRARAGEAAKPAADAPQLPTVTVPAVSVAARPVAPAAAGGAGSRVRATPAARRAAKERGVDIEAVAAAFPGKVLSEEDVRSFEP